jgi:hypothetical protein
MTFQESFSFLVGSLRFLFRKLGTSTKWIATLNARNCATEVANK